MRFAAVILGLAMLAGCGSPRRLTVAAASNLTEVFDEIGRGFTAETGIEIVFSYGSTAALARQVEEGAPLDVFAAADSEHVNALVRSGKVAAAAVYARGQVALWAPGGGVQGIRDLSRLKFVAISQPELAPYGQAAVDALKEAGVWDAVQPKLVYANSVSQAKQLAATGNADAAFTAYSLVYREAGSVVRIEKSLEQSLGVVVASARIEEARRFAAYVLGPQGRAALIQHGYDVDGR
jgi:molybdate transport system substrate-binding protein